MERESIGILELDKMIGGGLPRGGIIGLSGPPGVGKSILTLHFLLEGARKGQKSVYINLEEPEANILNMIEQFEFKKEFMKYVKSGKIVIKCFTYSEYEKINLELLYKIKEDKEIERLVIDSFNVFFSSLDNVELTLPVEVNVRKMICQSFSMLRRENLTTLLILEMQDNSPSKFFYNIPFLVDGIVSLDFLELGAIERRIFIPKMRWTNQYKESKEFDITNQGITIFGDEKE